MTRLAHTERERRAIRQLGQLIHGGSPDREEPQAIQLELIGPITIHGEHYHWIPKTRAVG